MIAMDLKAIWEMSVQPEPNSRSLTPVHGVVYKGEVENRF